MKKSLIFLSAICFVFVSLFTTAQNPYTASEILEKCIKYHDPEGKWANYSGKIKLNTSFPTGFTAGTEILEIDIAKDFYRGIRLAGGFKIVKGVENGKIFRSVNGNSNLPKEQLDKFGISDKAVLNMKTWHTWHFGKLAFFRSCGSVLQEKVTKSNLNGKDCYLITFIGDSSKVTNPYFAGEIGYYIDARTFAVSGMKWPSTRKMYEVFDGILEINGLKIPRLRTVYSADDNSLQYIDFFTRADDPNGITNELRTKSQPTAGNIGYISTHLLKLENEDAQKKLEQPIKEINETLAEIGYPECGYVVYRVTSEYKADYTHIMEGWWLSKEVYDETHNHPKYKEVFGKYRSLFEDALGGRTYFRMEKQFPKL